ncbi:MAG: PD-(D/E)XK nuclease family protein [Gammaproteobacteria bacterium]|nr:PD-(D/E)XK nuclease family protein [Gammaproteobacteria bacterium]
MKKIRFDCLQKLLKSDSIYTVGESTPPTLMQIAGFQDSEKAYSNILEFLLDSKQAHGFRTLFVESILAAYKKKCPDGWPGKDLNVSETEKVERESTTANGKRIDLLVECSEFVICIENKIWSGLHNDLGEYREHCEQMYDGRQVLGIVLSPAWLDEGKIEEHKFINVTYSDFAEELQHLSGTYIGRHNTQYQYLLFDFIEQASRFGGKKIMTDDQRKFLEFWRDNDREISNLQSACDGLKRELEAKKKAQAHIDECEKLLDPSHRELFRSWIYAGHVAVFDLADNGCIDQCSVHLDVVFHPLRVTHILGKRRGNIEPVKLASHVRKKYGIDFKKGSSVFHDERSPFEEKVRTAAVKNSIEILTALAEIRLSEQDRASNSP